MDFGEGSMKKSKAYREKKHRTRAQKHADKRKRTRKPYRADMNTPAGLLTDVPRGMGFLELLKRHPNTYRRAA